jgi:glycosyltransferase involved in cell wall biosynthesis
MKVAICVCTCDRPKGIDRLLTALKGIELGNQTPDLEIVVVDNQPDGRARAICDSHARDLGMPLHFFEEHQRGISFARNRVVLAALARGADYLASVDDDDMPKSDWLLRLLERQRETRAEIVMGTWRLPDNLALPRYLTQLRCLTQPSILQSSRYGIPHSGCCNVLIARRAIERLAHSPFRSKFAFTGGEDIDFFVRAHKAGARVAVAEDSVVIKDPGAARVSLAGALRDAFRSGCSRTMLSAEHLPPERYARLRRRLPKRLLKSVGRLSPFSLPTSVAALEDMAMVIGEVYGALGGQYAYYNRRTSSLWQADG